MKRYAFFVFVGCTLLVLGIIKMAQQSVPSPEQHSELKPLFELMPEFRVVSCGDQCFTIEFKDYASKTWHSTKSKLETEEAAYRVIESVKDELKRKYGVAQEMLEKVREKP